jgi:hypothetical protein
MIKKNGDGTYDIYVAPEAPKGREDNWVQTAWGRSGISSTSLSVPYFLA